MARQLVAVALTVACGLALAGCGGDDTAIDDGLGRSTDVPSKDDADQPAFRVLADERGAGDQPGIIVAQARAGYETLWSDLGLAGSPPEVDLADEVVVAFTVSYPSGCEFPFLSVEIDGEAGVITPRYGGNEPAECAADENPYTTVVALARDALPGASYEVRLTTVGQDVAAATAVELQPAGSPFPDLPLGQITEFEEAGLTELFAPVDVVVVSLGEGPVAFIRKDPNNGCRFQLADDVEDLELPTGAAFFDPCHGHVYDRQGAPLDEGNERSLRILPTEVRDGVLVWVRDVPG